MLTFACTLALAASFQPAAGDGYVSAFAANFAAAYFSNRVSLVGAYSIEEQPWTHPYLWWVNKHEVPAAGEARITFANRRRLFQKSFERQRYLATRDRIPVGRVDVFMAVANIASSGDDLIFRRTAHRDLARLADRPSVRPTLELLAECHAPYGDWKRTYPPTFSDYRKEYSGNPRTVAFPSVMTIEKVTTARNQKSYSDTLFVCGAKAHIPEVRECIAIVDGDVVIEDPQPMHTNLIYANGDILILAKKLDRFCLVARGRIHSFNPCDISSCTLIAGEEIDVLVPEGQAKGEQIVDAKQADLGFRFFSLDHVGLQLTTEKDAAVVKGVTATSAFAGVLSVGDKVTKLNLNDVRTAADCRWAMREAVALGFAYLAWTDAAGTSHKRHVHLPWPYAKAAAK